MKRFFYATLILLLGLMIHPFAGLFLGAVLIIKYYPHYYEIIAYGALMDVSYQTQLAVFGFMIPCYTLLALLVFYVAQHAGKQLNFYV